jgi:hypothetical protein
MTALSNENVALAVALLVWAVIDGIVFVRTCNGYKATQLGGSLPETIARLLIRELAGECRD